jgi:hypothetical protein
VSNLSAVTAFVEAVAVGAMHQRFLASRDERNSADSADKVIAAGAFFPQPAQRIAQHPHAERSHQQSEQVDDDEMGKAGLNHAMSG